MLAAASLAPRARVHGDAVAAALFPGKLLLHGLEVRDDDRRREVAASHAVEIERAPESAQG